MQVLRELYIIRHGQTDHNAQGIVQGKGVNLPLNNLGRTQAQQFFDTYKNVPFDGLFASSLLRAQQSIELFRNSNMPFEICSDLDEISWGKMEGQTNTQENDAGFQQMLKDWSAGKIHEKFIDGESPFELQQRQKKFIQQFLNSSHKKVLIATHGRFIRAFMCTLTGTDLSQMESFHHQNLCLYKVNYLEDETFKIELSCDTRHLTS
ncbi:MAG: histidine phosphatase family protein [Chitinophagales bacterium]|nr:histidine phosphatase family protein [Chitinophagales bacterium]MCO5279793.1 histidine phosphatase family protein [Chitinophagales bacterium]OJV30490.1 MAG: hypothetical protein BGO32_08860 [Bacteroidetes bacterium 37-13]HRN94565.1 histidine phosphatase family protein [Chitinophagales bacterium]HRP38796.1 histidine phosphatase family protein [Chitinophagales bacterium]